MKEHATGPAEERGEMLRNIFTVLPLSIERAEPKEVIENVAAFLELALRVIAKKQGIEAESAISIAQSLSSQRRPRNRWPKNLWGQVIEVLRFAEQAQHQSEEQWCMRACLELNALGIHLPWTRSSSTLLPFLRSRLLELCRYAMRAAQAKAATEVRLISPSGQWKPAPAVLEPPFTLVVRPSGIAINGWVLPMGAVTRAALGWLGVQLESLMREETPERIEAILDAMEKTLGVDEPGWRSADSNVSSSAS